MPQPNIVKAATRFAILLLCLSTFWSSAVIRAQSGDKIEELKEKASDLIRQTRYTEALPLLEKIVVAEPDNARMHFYLGFALLGQAINTQNAAQRKALRVRARNAFIRSKDLRIDEPVVDALIDSLPVDGSEGAAFSQNIRANALMTQAEGHFSQGKLDDALKNYQMALDLDPQLYHAALFSGDVFMQKGDFAKAELWYKKAIAIDPTKETAYRYSATPLMKQGKTEEARDRYVEAFITEPYNKFARAGLIQWAQATHISLAHPKIDIPTNVTFDEKGDAKINLDAGTLLGGTDDGSFAWIAYGATRSTWHKEKFAQKFPGKGYRHSLAEEADALRSVISIATADKKTKSLSPSLAKLKKLNDEGLLEAYILLARPDDGISQDHPAYLKENRDKLRRYIVEYVLTGGQGGSPPKSAA
ncbi:MAG TPA: tetratricopeptide repeat protein [Pyrinomonadaceae bacterium]|nr:tetratricopeptide repeat protein [Pyrinomonadaceae bacterium]